MTMENYNVSDYLKKNERCQSNQNIKMTFDMSNNNSTNSSTVIIDNNALIDTVHYAKAFLNNLWHFTIGVLSEYVTTKYISSYPHLGILVKASEPQIQLYGQVAINSTIDQIVKFIDGFVVANVTNNTSNVSQIMGDLEMLSDNVTIEQ